MEKRYQVFVSSTFRDLQVERQHLIQALLELDCIPSGMELFPAADEDQWSLIKRVIDDCDYYVLVIAGRYGSLGKEGIGYTEMEYDYAYSIKKPIIAFLHANPGALRADLTETDPASVEKLRAFRSKVEKRQCRYWENPGELGGRVSRSLVQLFKTKPAEGWVKAIHAKRADDMSERLNAVSENVSAFRHSLDSLSVQLTPKLFALYQCKEDFQRTLKNLPTTEHIHIDHFGLDMTQAWEYVHNSLNNVLLNFNILKFRLLMLTDDRRKVHRWPKEVKDWSTSVPMVLDSIEQDMDLLIPILSQTGKKINFEVRKYDSTPIVHGWAIRQPVKVYYFAFCRWRASKFDWGGENYFIVNQSSQNPVIDDLTKIFDGYFDRAWSQSVVEERLKYGDT